MRAVAACAVAVSLFACKDNPSPLDPVLAAGSGATPSTSDPWGAIAKRDAAENPSEGGSGGLGFDLQGILDRIKDAVETPGPYEAPKKSKDFDEAKAHWGVMA